VGRIAVVSAVIGVSLVLTVGASPGTRATNVPVLTGTWDLTTKVLANSDPTGWLGPTYRVGASNTRTWRFEQSCNGADCQTDVVRVTDVSEPKVRIAYRGDNEFVWQEYLTSKDTCNGVTFPALTVLTSFVMKVKAGPSPTGRPIATSLEAVGDFVANVNVGAYINAGCNEPPSQIRYTIRYTGDSPTSPSKRKQVYAGPAPGLRPATVRLPGKAASPITPRQAIPQGTVVDVSNGRGVTLADPKGAKSVFYGEKGRGPSVFVYAGVVQGLAELRLTGGGFGACKEPVRSLSGKGKGAFRTKGRYASAAARSASWSTADSCTSTVVQVRQGVMTVRDLVKRKTVTVKAPKSYSAGP
jgi:hypothetical protein